MENEPIIGEGTTTLDWLLSKYPWLRDCLKDEYRNGTSKPKLIIMRGLPGSGKSTKARETQNKMLQLADARGHIIVSTDDYWIRPDQTYDWNPKLLGKAHEWTRARAQVNMCLRDTHVILDNTNIKKRDYQAYIDIAEKYNYCVEEIIIGEFTDEACQLYASRNTHGVPLETIQRMAKSFEP
jgi:predicted kinase